MNDFVADTSPGLWRQCLDHGIDPSVDLARTYSATPRAGLFLDRDGVVLEEINYLQRISDMRLIEGTTTLIHAANQRDIPVILVTNQSGVGRGYYGWHEFAEVQAKLLDWLSQEDARLDMVLACAYHESAEHPFDVANHPWRKPAPGMLQEAAKALALDLSRSWIIGDSASDIQAGRNAGLAGGMHVATGHGERDRTMALSLATTTFEVRPVISIGDALPVLSSFRPQE